MELFFFLRGLFAFTGRDAFPTRWVLFRDHRHVFWCKVCSLCWTSWPAWHFGSIRISASGRAWLFFRVKHMKLLSFAFPSKTCILWLLTRFRGKICCFSLLCCTDQEVWEGKCIASRQRLHFALPFTFPVSSEVARKTWGFASLPLKPQSEIKSYRSKHSSAPSSNRPQFQTSDPVIWTLCVSWCFPTEWLARLRCSCRSSRCFNVKLWGVEMERSLSWTLNGSLKTTTFDPSFRCLCFWLCQLTDPLGWNYKTMPWE